MRYCILSEATFVSLKTMDKKEFRVLIKHYFLAKKNSVEAKAWLDKHYSDSAPGKSTIEKWFEKFKRGEMTTEDDACSGRPKEAVTDENHKKVRKIILDDLKVRLIETSEALKIPKKPVGHTLNDYFGMRKFCAKWVLCKLTISQK